MRLPWACSTAVVHGKLTACSCGKGCCSSGSATMAGCSGSRRFANQHLNASQPSELRNLGNEAALILLCCQRLVGWLSDLRFACILILIAGLAKWVH